MIEWLVGAVIFGAVGNLLGDEKKSPPRIKPRPIKPSAPTSRTSSSPSSLSLDTNISSLAKNGNTETERVSEPPTLSELLSSRATDTDSEKTGQDDETIYLSTTMLSRSLGLHSNKILFEDFMQRGLLKRINRKYELTEAGRVYGKYAFAEDGSKYVVWNPITTRGLIEEPYLREIREIGFRLFHMTHFDNISSILQNGLLPHASAPAHLDISNISVNTKRGFKTAHDGRSLHEYVPLYFNPRNAMLYEKQREYNGKIAILEISQSACLRPKVLFSEGNAASAESKLVDSLADLKDFNWKRINAPTWIEDRIKNLSTRRLMMSECLMPGKVEASEITTVHVEDSVAMQSMKNIATLPQGTKLRISPELFFSDKPSTIPPNSRGET